MDAWFAIRGVQRARIRDWVAPFANSEWLSNFPSYAVGLAEQTAYYSAVVNGAFIRYGALLGDPPPNARLLALEQARRTFSFPDQNMPLDSVARLRCLYQVALEICDVLRPTSLYELPSITDPIYSHIAPLPEREERQLLLPNCAAAQAHSQDEEISVVSAHNDVAGPAVEVSRPSRGRGRARGRGWSA